MTRLGHHKKHRKLITDDLADDFEYVLDPENLKKVFRRQDKRMEEAGVEGERSARLIEISNYITKLCLDPKRLTAIMTYPTIWTCHADQLAKLEIDVRVKITDIITSYLTGDEYLFLELLPELKKRPTADEIVDAYKLYKPKCGESTFSKVCRFLTVASDMAKENLDLLADEMHTRYNRNKMNIEKVIVETVDGSDGSQEKIRTITAFRTPFPPYILVSTSVLAEGVDLHTECRHIIHYDHEWNPASLEQKTGRVDRVGSKADRLSEKIEIGMPYIKHTQDEKAFRVVMARKSWFDTVMGENYEAKWDVSEFDKESLFPLPDRVREELRMELDNEAHLRAMKT